MDNLLSGSLSMLMLFLLTCGRERAQAQGDSAALRSQASSPQLSVGSGSCAENVGESRRALELSPQDAAPELRLARSLALCGQFAEAIARYRHVLQMQSQSGGPLVELGDTLLRARRHEEAIPVFRKALEANAKDLGAILGLAQALAATGNYREALLRYDEALKTSPENYDALQGTACVLFWTHEFAQARAIFQRLQDANPNDPQNAAALEGVTRAEEQARWTAARPPPDAPPRDFLRYYERRLARYPRDRSAMMGVGYTQAQLKNFPAAIQAYRQVLKVYSDDRDAKVQLAQVLSWDRQYEASIGLYREVLQSAPDDGEALEGLARVYVWSGHLGEASQIYQGLLARNPSNPGYSLELARLESRLKNYPASHEGLASLLSADTQNREARLQLAQLDLRRGDWASSLKQFNLLLDQNPRDSEALYGRAQIAYYQSHLREALAIATRLVKEQPDNFDNLFLLANVERARRRRRAALAFLNRADRLSPGNPEVAATREKVREESIVTIHTSASYAREIGPPEELLTKASKFTPQTLIALARLGLADAETGLPVVKDTTGLPNQDLRSFSYGITIGFLLLPRTDSYVSFTSLPVGSPPGPARDEQDRQLSTPLTGAVGPSEFLYRQTTRISSQVAVRGGAGFVRFGPGRPQSMPVQFTGELRSLVTVLGPDVLRDILAKAQPVQTERFSPMWLAGFTVAPTQRLTLDLDVSRSPVLYTPISVKLGVIEDRIDGGVNFFFTPRTELRVDYFSGRYSSVPFGHYDVMNVEAAKLPVRCIPLVKCLTVSGQLTSENKADHDQVHGGSVLFKRKLFGSEHLSFDGGYTGLAYGFAGARRKVSLGFFNPGFYQRHLATARFYGRLRGPLSYDFSGGIGLQQVEQRQALTRALILSPALTLKATPRLSLTLGYTHYNFAQTLGTLRGNAVRLSTDWKF